MSPDVPLEGDVDRCPVCGSTGALTPCYGPDGAQVPDHDGRPTSGVGAL